MASSFKPHEVRQVLQAHHAVPSGLLDAAVLGELRARFVSPPTT
jgi:hypothetical protein